MVRHWGRQPFSSMYPKKDGIFRAFHLEVEFKEMLMSSWFTKGLLNRSSTAAAGAVKKVKITEEMTAEDVLKGALRHLAFL